MYGPLAAVASGESSESAACRPESRPRQTFLAPQTLVQAAGKTPRFLREIEFPYWGKRGPTLEIVFPGLGKGFSGSGNEFQDLRTAFPGPEIQFQGLGNVSPGLGKGSPGLEMRFPGLGK